MAVDLRRIAELGASSYLLMDLVACALGIAFFPATLAWSPLTCVPMVGDSLRQRIDEGLATSRYGVVILSPNFFSKPWPQAELDGLYSRQSASGQKVILPIWHHISKDEVTAASPLLAGMLALNTSLMSLDEIVKELLKVLRPQAETTEEPT